MADVPPPPPSPTPPIPPGQHGQHGAPGDFSERVFRYLHDALPAQQLEAFNRELAEDPQKREWFVRACMIEASVSEELSTQYHVFRDALVAAGRPADEIPSCPSSETSAEMPERSPAPPVRWRRWALAAAVALVAIPTALLLLRPGTPAPAGAPVVATITASSRAAWQAPPPGGSELPAHREFTLTAGWAEITSSAGAHIVIVAPATFSFESARDLALRHGRLSAHIDGGGFTVDTPDARITDLGTEFGVRALETTQVAVFSGKVEAGSRREGQAPRLLVAGEAARVEGDQVVLDTQTTWPQMFPRRLSSEVRSLSLADLLSGGDGTMKRRAAALDPSTGRWTFGRGTLAPVSTTGDGRYHSVPQLPVVDGCFIPNGRMQVDSAGRTGETSGGGHQFEFSSTRNISVDQLWVGGRIPWPANDPHKMSGTLGGIAYGSGDHALLEMHSNKGITIDLEALRAIHPGSALTEFRGVVGNTFPATQGGEAFVARTDLFVLVDGQERLAKRGFSNQDAPLQVRIPLAPADRFVTLAVTDGGDGVDGDWILWGDPEILVAPEPAP